MPLATLIDAADRYVDCAGLSIDCAPQAPLADPSVLAPIGLSAELQRTLLDEFEIEFDAMKLFFQ